MYNSVPGEIIININTNFNCVCYLLLLASSFSLHFYYCRYCRNIRHDLYRYTQIEPCHKNKSHCNKQITSHQTNHIITNKSHHNKQTNHIISNKTKYVLKNNKSLQTHIVTFILVYFRWLYRQDCVSFSRVLAGSTRTVYV